MYSPSQRQAGALVVNIHSTLRTGPDLCKNVSFAVSFGSNGNSYTILHSQIYIYIYMQWLQRAGNLAACHSGQACQRIVSPELRGDLPTESVPRNLFTHLYIAVVFRKVAFGYFVCVLESLPYAFRHHNGISIATDDWLLSLQTKKYVAESAAFYVMSGLTGSDR